MKDLAGFLPFVLIALVFWFLIVRPQRRRQQALAATQSALGVGSEVMLGSGIFGRVASFDDETIRLEVAPGTLVKVSRAAIVRVLDGEGLAPHDTIDPMERGEDFPNGDDRHQ
jgi:preprotein translocase subunit YajC